MEKVYIVLQESNVDGEIITNVVPCISKETAKAIMDKEIRTLLSSGKYKGLDLDEIERGQNDANADCDFYLERDDTTFFLNCLYDDYYEKIDILEKEIQF